MPLTVHVFCACTNIVCIVCVHLDAVCWRRWIAGWSFQLHQPLSDTLQAEVS